MADIAVVRAGKNRDAADNSGSRAAARSVGPDAGLTQRLTALLDIARALGSTLELDDVLTLLIARVTALLDADRSTLFLLDERTDELWSKIAQGSTLKEIRLPVGKGLAGWVARHGLPLNLRD